MRLLPRLTTLTLALAFVWGCADSPADPAADHTPPPGPAFLTSLEGDSLEVEIPLLDVTDWDDERTIIPLEVLTPEAASNIGPGSAIVITIPDEGRFGCTANFIFQARGEWRRFLGSAGHCFLPGDRTATHGPGADYDASGVVVEVCVEDCEGNFQTNLLVGTWVTLNQVAYARQNDGAGTAVGFDFGVVEIPRELNDLVRTSLPVWGGPTGIDRLALGDVACHYGHGVGVGEIFPTKARSGVGGGATDEAWHGDFVASFGDSGSALVACHPEDEPLVGEEGLGVLTHLGIRLNADTGEHGVILGNNLQHSIDLARRDASLKLRLILEGDQ